MVIKTETALDWFNRSQRRRIAAEIPTDPSSAAWNFLRNGSSGIAPIDAAWRIPSANTDLPVVVLEGSVGKTWTLLSLAARFVVATRSSRFASSSSVTTTEEQSFLPLNNNHNNQPQVIFLDSTFDMTIPKLSYIVRSTLLRWGLNQGEITQQPGINDQNLDLDLESCLSRIHLSTVDEFNDAWVPILECLRCKLKTFTKHPTLVLWDGFFFDANANSKQHEVRRQVLRLLQDCSVALVVTGAPTSSSSSNNNSSTKAGNIDWLSNNKTRDVHRIRFERRSGKDCFAIVNGTKLPFSLSLGGILS